MVPQYCGIDPLIRSYAGIPSPERAKYPSEGQSPSPLRRLAPGGGTRGPSTVVTTDLSNVYGLLPDGAGGFFVGDHAGRVLRQRADATSEVVIDRIGRPGGMARTADGALLIAEFVDFGARGRLLRVTGLR